MCKLRWFEKRGDTYFYGLSQTHTFSEVNLYEHTWRRVTPIETVDHGKKHVRVVLNENDMEMCTLLQG